MPLIYRTSGAWGAGKGGNLTPAEVDANFYGLDQRIDDLEAGLTPNDIVDITVAGTQMTLTLADSTVLGPVTLPRAVFVWRGNWTAAASYQANDVVRVPGEGLFLVAVDHTAPAVWDEGHTVGGDDAYILMFSEPRATVATVSATTLTLATAQAYAYLRCTNASGCAVTVPTDADDPMPIGTEFHIRQSAAGAVTVAGDTGVLINLPAGLLAETGREGAVITAKKVDVDEWDLFGLLAEDA